MEKSVKIDFFFLPFLTIFFEKWSIFLKLEFFFTKIQIFLISSTFSRFFLDFFFQLIFHLKLTVVGNDDK